MAEEMLDTKAVVRRLREEGFIFDAGYLSGLIFKDQVKQPKVILGGSYAWSPGEIEALRQALRARGRGPSVERLANLPIGTTAHLGDGAT